MDSDLDQLTREQLAAEVRRLRAGIRAHRDSSGQDLCWHHPALWGLLPEKTDPVPRVPDWPQFMRGCVRYRQSLDEQAPDAPRTAQVYGPGALQLDHLVVPSRNRHAAARQLAGILGVRWADAGIGPFSAVYVNDGLTLDFDQAEGDFPVLHYCFRTSEEGFDAIVARLREQGIPLRASPQGPADGRTGTFGGGRVVYWSEPDGHYWEALTVSYAREGPA